VNELLKEFEQKLYAMNLGVEVWAYDDPLTTSPTSFYDGIKDQEYRESHDMVLGWGRLGEKFGLLVLSVKYRWELGKWVMIDENPRTPLLQAPREIRIAALGKIEALISALRERAQELVNSIKTAQQTIEKL
jgi:hypothetical protein